MTVLRRLLLVVVLLLLGGSALFPVCARAESSRPNGLDRRVDSLQTVQLEHQPAVKLVDADRQVAAQRLARWMLPGWFASIAFQVLVLAYFWQSGAAAKLRDRLRNGLRNDVYVRFFFGAALVLIARVAALIPAFYAFRVGRVMGISSVLLRAWSITWLLNTLLAMVIAGVVVAFVLWLVNRTHQWYIYTMLAIVAGSFIVSYVQPFFGSPSLREQKPLPASFSAAFEPLRSAAHQSVPILIDRRTDGAQTGAIVEGLGPTRRIVLTQGIMASGSVGELRFIVAHELGELAANDPVRVAAYNALLVILGIALAVFIADRIGFRRDDDPIARLALVAALLGCVYIVVAPIDNAILQKMSWSADRYAIALTGDPDSAVRAVVRSTDQHLDETCPGMASRWFLTSIPPAGDRIAALNHVPSGCP